MSSVLLTAIGSKVWVDLGPESEDVYLTGEVVQSAVLDESGVKHCKVRDEKGHTHLIKYGDVKQIHPLSVVGVPDILQLSDYGPESLLSSLRIRYGRDQIYTFVGPILVSINPYKWLLDQLGSDTMRQYHGRSNSEMQQSPHIFCTAENAYRNLVTNNVASNGKNQAIIISGESGAGKTEATKLVMKYLAQVTVSENGTKTKEKSLSNRKKGKSRKKKRGEDHTTETAPRRTLEQRVLDTNPLLEAFGNAKTLRNDNSSRFGKFIQIQFDPNGKIGGARIINYLLEKSRIIHQSKGERNYHIFYQIFAGASTSLKAKLFLSRVEKYRYLCESNCFRVKNIDDKEQFIRTMDCMESIGISEEERDSVLQTVASVLHIGNIRFKAAAKEVDGCTIDTNVADTDSDLDEEDSCGYDSIYDDSSTCEPSDGENATDASGQESIGQSLRIRPNLSQAEKVAQLCGLDVAELEAALCSRFVTIAGDRIQKPILEKDAMGRRDALARALYALLFRWLVKRLNERIHSRDHSHFIGVLDIYGFEQFKTNSFEQFCINYANEKLQQHFNRHIFEVEQAEYEREGIDWSRIEFNNNQLCLDLIEKSPLSVSCLLDEECLMPQGSDNSLLLKLHKTFGGDTGASQGRRLSRGKGQEGNPSGHPHYIFPRLGNHLTFGVKHYAGEVLYNVDGFLRKNNDMLSEELNMLMATSKSKWVRSLFAVTSNKAAAHSRSRSSSSLRPPTVSQQFKKQLQSLMDKLEECTPHYVRCIKPNSKKLPDFLDGGKCLEQLRYAGMFETIRIRNQGYALRESHSDFFTRYRVLAPSAQSCQQLVQQLSSVLAPSGELSGQGGQAQWQMGHTKVFIRKEISGVLEAIARIRISVASRIIQRQYKVYRIWKRECAAVLLQRQLRMYLATRYLARVRRDIVQIQSVVRMHQQCNRFWKLQSARVNAAHSVQRWYRAKQFAQTIAKLAAKRREEEALRKAIQEQVERAQLEKSQVSVERVPQVTEKPHIEMFALDSNQRIMASEVEHVVQERTFAAAKEEAEDTTEHLVTNAGNAQSESFGTSFVKKKDIEDSVRVAVEAAVASMAQSQEANADRIRELEAELSHLRSTQAAAVNQDNILAEQLRDWFNGILEVEEGASPTPRDFHATLSGVVATVVQDDLAGKLKQLKQQAQQSTDNLQAKNAEVSSLQTILGNMRREMTKTEQNLKSATKQLSLLETHHKSVASRERQVLHKLERVYSRTMAHFGLEDFDETKGVDGEGADDAAAVSGIRRLENVVDRLVLGLQFGYRLGGREGGRGTVRRASASDIDSIRPDREQEERQQQMITTLMHENVQLMDEVLDSRNKFQTLHEALEEAQERIQLAENANATLCSLLAWRDDQLLACYARDANDPLEAQARAERLGSHVAHVSEAIHQLAPYFHAIGANGLVEQPCEGKQLSDGEGGLKDSKGEVHCQKVSIPPLSHAAIEEQSAFQIA